MGVSKNRGGPPKSSILIGCSIIFPIHFGVPLFLETPTYHHITCYIHLWHFHSAWPVFRLPPACGGDALIFGISVTHAQSCGITLNGGCPKSPKDFELIRNICSPCMRGLWRPENEVGMTLCCTSSKGPSVFCKPIGPNQHLVTIGKESPELVPKTLVLELISLRVN